MPCVLQVLQRMLWRPHAKLEHTHTSQEIRDGHGSGMSHVTVM